MPRPLACTAVSALVLATAGTALMALAPAASADPWSVCPDGYSCFWNSGGFSGAKWQFAGTNGNWANFGRSNQDNSMVNDGNTQAVRIFDYTGQSKAGRWMCVARGYGWSSYPSPYAANITSSNNWYGGDNGNCSGA